MVSVDVFTSAFFKAEVINYDERVNKNYALQCLCFNCLLPEVKKCKKIPNDQNDQTVEQVEHVKHGLLLLHGLLL